MELSCHIDFVYLKGWVWKFGMRLRGVSHPYVAKGHVISGQGKGRWYGSLGPSWERGRPKGTMGLPYMASNGLLLRFFVVVFFFCFFFGKARTFKRVKGSLSSPDEVCSLIW